MNILLIHSLADILSPTKPLRSPDQMQFGISYISSLLQKNGHATKLVVLSRLLGSRNFKIMDAQVKIFKPRLICFTSVYTEFSFINTIAKYLKKRYPDVFLLIGGPHASLNPDEVMACGNFDALCVGEGEYPTLEIVAQLEQNKQPSGILNLWIKQGNKIQQNPPRPFLQDLDILPFPDRQMWQEWTEEVPDAVHAVLLGRGCPFQCTYCCNLGLRKIASGKYVRFRSPENILAEIKDFHARYPQINNIYLEVETIGADKEWALRLCAKLREFNTGLKQPLAYSTNLRIMPNMDLESLFSALKKSNFTMLKIGLESGSERVRREILKRDYSNTDIIKAVSLARKYGLGVFFYNLVGIPGETLSDFKETIKVNRACLPDVSIPHVFFPYPGTELYALCKERGLLPKILESGLERSESVLDLPGFSKKQIQESYSWFDYDVYKGHKPMHKILAKVLVSKLISNAFLHAYYRRLTYLPVFKRIRFLISKSRRFKGD